MGDDQLCFLINFCTMHDYDNHPPAPALPTAVGIAFPLPPKGCPRQKGDTPEQHAMTMTETTKPSNNHTNLSSDGLKRTIGVWWLSAIIANIMVGAWISDLPAI